MNDIGTEFFSGMMGAISNVVLNLSILQFDTRPGSFGDLGGMSFIQLITTVCAVIGLYKLFQTLKDGSSGSQFAVEMTKFGFFIFIMYANYGVINPRDYIGYDMPPGYDYSIAKNDSKVAKQIMSLNSGITGSNTVTLDRDIFNLLAATADGMADRIQIKGKKSNVIRNALTGQSNITSTQDLQAATMQNMVNFIRRAGEARMNCSSEGGGGTQGTNALATCVLPYLPSLDGTTCLAIKGSKISNGPCRGSEEEIQQVAAQQGTVGNNQSPGVITRVFDAVTPDAAKEAANAVAAIPEAIAYIIKMFTYPLIMIVIPVAFFILTLIKQAIGFVLILKFTMLSAFYIILIKIMTPVILISPQKRMDLLQAYKKLASVALFGFVTEFIILLTTIFTLALNQQVYELILPELIGGGNFALKYAASIALIFICIVLIFIINIQGYNKVPELAEQFVDLSVGNIIQTSTGLVSSSLSLLGTVVSGVIMAAGTAAAIGAKLGMAIPKIMGAVGKMGLKGAAGGSGMLGKMARGAIGAGNKISGGASAVMGRVDNVRDGARSKVRTLLGSDSARDQERSARSSGSVLTPRDSSSGGTSGGSGGGNTPSDSGTPSSSSSSETDPSGVNVPFEGNDSSSVNNRNSVSGGDGSYSGNENDGGNIYQSSTGSKKLDPRNFRSKRAYAKALSEQDGEYKKSRLEKTFGGPLRGMGLVGTMAGVVKYGLDQVASGGADMNFNSQGKFMGGMNETINEQKGKALGRSAGYEGKLQEWGEMIDDGVYDETTYAAFGDENDMSKYQKTKELASSMNESGQISEENPMYEEKLNRFNELESELQSGVISDSKLKEYSLLAGSVAGLSSRKAQVLNQKYEKGSNEAKFQQALRSNIETRRNEYTEAISNVQSKTASNADRDRLIEMNQSGEYDDIRKDNPDLVKNIEEVIKNDTNTFVSNLNDQVIKENDLKNKEQRKEDLIMIAKAEQNRLRDDLIKKLANNNIISSNKVDDDVEKVEEIIREEIKGNIEDEIKKVIKDVEESGKLINADLAQQLYDKNLISKSYLDKCKKS